MTVWSVNGAARTRARARRRRSAVVAAVALGVAVVTVLGQADGWWGGESVVAPSPSGPTASPPSSLALESVLDLTPDGELDVGAPSVDVAVAGPIDVDRLLALDPSADCAEPAEGPAIVVGVVTEEPLGLLPPGEGESLLALGARRAAELVNCGGGVAGSPVEVVAVGAGGSALASRDAVDDLLEREPAFIIGPPSLEIGLRAAEAVGGRVAMLFPLGAEPALGASAEARFLLGPDAVALADAASGYAVGEGWERSVVVTSGERLAQLMAASFVDGFEVGDGTVTATVVLDRLGGGGESTPPAFDALLDRLGVGSDLQEPPDVVFSALSLDQLPALASALRLAGVDTPVLTVDLRTEAATPAGPLDGVLIAGWPGPGPGGDDRLARFSASLSSEAPEGEPIPPIAAARVADAVLLGLHAVGASASSDGPDAAGVVAELRAGTALEGILGPVSTWPRQGDDVTDLPSVVPFDGGLPALETGSE